MTSAALPGPLAILDGPFCFAVWPHVRPLAEALAAAGRHEYDQGFTAIATVAEAERARKRSTMTFPSSGWLTVKEAARIENVGVRAIQQRARRGTVASERQGRRLLIDPVSLSEHGERLR